MPDPSFVKKKGNSVVFNEDGEFLLYVPDAYFTDTKFPLASILGQYVNLIGVCDWALVTPNGKVSEAKRFYFPSMFMCKPNRIETVKNLSLNNLRAIDYRILHFKNGDEIICNVNIPKSMDPVETLFKATLVNTGKLPPSVPYNKIQDYLIDSIRISGNNYGISPQLFGIVVSESARNPKDTSEPFRYTKMNNMYDYVQLPMNTIAKHVSPFVAFVSENFDESVMAAQILSEDPETDKIESPLEKLLMG